MRLNRFIMENKKYVIYVDMDGVLTDFLQGVSSLINKDIKSFEEWSKIKKTEWKSIANNGVKFWENLKWMPDGKQLWDYVSKYNPNILSAFPINPINKKYAIIGKQKWIDNNLTNVNNVYLVKGIDKQKYAKPNSILIDDAKRNIDQWISKGGIGILHTNTKKTIKELKQYGI